MHIQKVFCDEIYAWVEQHKHPRIENAYEKQFLQINFVLWAEFDIVAYIGIHSSVGRQNSLKLKSKRQIDFFWTQKKGDLNKQSQNKKKCNSKRTKGKQFLGVNPNSPTISSL